MKRTHYSSLVVASLLAIAHTGSAELILTDNFTVSGLSSNPNSGISAGNGGVRQGGTHAGSLWNIATTNGDGTMGGPLFLGNTTTNVGQPVVSDGNYLLLEGTATPSVSSGVQNQLEITPALVNGKPLTISFDMYVTGDDASNVGFNATNWSAFTLRIANKTFPTSGATGFGMLVRYNGGVQFFNNGVKFDQPAGYSTTSLWSFTFTDLAGTGSAFAGNGSKVTFVNGTNTGTITLAQLSTTGGLFVGFQNQQSNYGGIDNLTISTVPEPSTFGAAVVAGLGFLIVLRRMRRA
jgi:hypothetical protein